MAKICPVFPPEVEKEYNSLSQKYNKQNIPIEEARRQAANDLLAIAEEELARRSLGSQSNISDQVTPKWEETLLTKNLQQVFDRLGNEDKSITGYVSVEQERRLQSLIDTVVFPLMNSLDGYTIKAGETDNETFGRAELVEKEVYVSTNRNPILHGLQLSSQEVMVHEILHVLTAVVAGNKYDLKAPAHLKIAARKLFNLARANTTWKSLLPRDSQGNVIITPGSTLEITEQAAKARWDYIFNSENGLLEFVAFGNTNEQFIKELSKIKIKEDKAKPANLAESLKQWIQDAITWLTNRIFKIEGQDVASALQALTYEIAGIKKKHNYFMDVLGLAGEAVRFTSAKPVELLLWGLSKGIDTLPDSRFKEVLEGLKQFPQTLKSKQFAKGISWMADRLFKQREYFLFNILSKLPSELVGMTEANQRFWARLRYSKNIIDVQRHKIRDAAIKNYMEAFRTPLSMDEDRSLYFVMAADMAKLKELGYSYQEIQEFLTNNTKLFREIDKHRNDLIKDEGDIAYGLIRQAEGLAKFMISKDTFNHGNQMLNAINIVDLKFDPNTDKRVSNRANALNSVSALISLYALSKINKQDKTTIADVFKRELEVDLVDNGIANYMSMIQVHKIQSLDKNFDGKERLTRAGFTTDIFDPNVSTQFSDSPNDLKLVAEGYSLVDKKPLKKGRNARHSSQYMYMSKFNGLVPFNKATISLTSQQQFGTNLSDIYAKSGLEGKQAYIAAEEETNRVLNSLEDPYTKKYDTSELTNLIPVTNENGNTVGFRYVMSEDVRGEMLRKNYRASVVLSTMYEQMTDKYETIDLNKKVVQDLVEDKKQFGVKRAKEYITITKNHPKYGELYKRIPETMKLDLDKAFGKGKLIIREPLVDMVFGMPQYSISREGLNNFIGKMLIMLMKAIEMFRKKDVNFINLSPEDQKKYKDRKATMLLRQAESGWQELVSEVKTSIILKTLVLPLNIASNLFFSFMHGMPLDYTLKKQAEAIVALNEYNEKLRRKLILENRIKSPDITDAAKKNLQGQINQLNFDLDNSIVKSLVDKGVLNSIVEDIELDMEANVYSLRGQLVEKLEKKFDKVPNVLKYLYKQANMTRSTGLFKFMETTTRYSDFVARYAMYEWLTKEKGIKGNDALATTMAAFVEYDPPTSRELQYLNDIGLFMFTKYTVRIQKAVAKLFLDKPDTAIGFVLLQKMLGIDVADPSDNFVSASWNHVFEGFNTMVLPGVNLPLDYLDLVIPG